MNLQSSGLIPEHRNSKHLKVSLAHHLYWRLQYPVVVDEFKYMDIFGINKNGFGIEFEIKISKSDFDRELRLIQSIDQPEKYSKDWEKWYKHAKYLKKNIDEAEYDEYTRFMIENGLYKDDKYYIPNEFYFYVPDYLTEYALKKLTDLPYGLIQIGNISRNGGISFFFWPYEKIKRASKLHNEKVNNLLYNELAHALTIRNKLLN